jgi:hypothetical protein
LNFFGLFDVDFLGFFHKIVEFRLHVSKIVGKEHNIICIVPLLLPSKDRLKAPSNTIRKMIVFNDAEIKK